mgnify:FL=1
MHKIMEKTFELIDVIDDSEMMKELEEYKSQVLENKEIQELLKVGNSTSIEYEQLEIKKKLYEYPEYRGYMKYYDELMFLVMKINQEFKKFTKNGRRCVR